jgi:hypothetical protein
VGSTKGELHGKEAKNSHQDWHVGGAKDTGQGHDGSNATADKDRTKGANGGDN